MQRWDAKAVCYVPGQLLSLMLAAPVQKMDSAAEISSLYVVDLSGTVYKCVKKGTSQELCRAPYG